MDTRQNYYNYFTEIEETFVRRRSRNLLLSPVDWALMESWQDRGVPLHIVIRSIEQVFDNFDKNPGPRSIKGLVFCREEVEAQFLEWHASQAGKTTETDSEAGPGSFSLSEAAEHIHGLIDSLRLRQADLIPLSEDIDRACIRLNGLLIGPGDNFETIDKSLRDVESLLDDALVKNADRSLLASVEKEIKGHLKPHKAVMSDEAYKSTYKIMLLKRLKEELHIPRLSLFYL